MASEGCVCIDYVRLQMRVSWRDQQSSRGVVVGVVVVELGDGVVGSCVA